MTIVTSRDTTEPTHQLSPWCFWHKSKVVWSEKLFSQREMDILVE